MISFLRCCTCPPKKYNKKPHHHSAAGAMARFLSHQFGEHWALSSWAGAHSRSYFTLIPSYDFPKLIPLQLGKISILSPWLKIGNKKNKFVDVKRGRVPWSVAAISTVNMLGIQRRKKTGDLDGHCPLKTALNIGFDRQGRICLIVGINWRQVNPPSLCAS